MVNINGKTINVSVAVHWGSRLGGLNMELNLINNTLFCWGLVLKRSFISFYIAKHIPFINHYNDTFSRSFHVKKHIAGWYSRELCLFLNPHFTCSIPGCRGLYSGRVSMCSFTSGTPRAGDRWLMICRASLCSGPPRWVCVGLPWGSGMQNRIRKWLQSNLKIDLHWLLFITV